VSGPTASPSSASVADHRAAAPDAIRCAVLTVSDTRTEEMDSSGALIRRRLEESGHRVVAYRIVKDEPDEICDVVEAWVTDPAVQAIVSNGGTGIAARDTTYDVVAGLLEKRLDGFGELFRMLSYAEIGAAAMLSRAVAGVYRGTVVFVLPGSSNAVGLALEKLILPELGHVVFEVTKQQRA
jgi:molybdenum cofactor biosynthesis protein B